MTQALTDITSLVDEAFSEQDCCGFSPESHGGEQIAYQIGHGCMDGFLCKVHFETALGVIEDAQQVMVDVGAILCTRCRRTFDSVDEFMKVYSL